MRTCVRMEVSFKPFVKYILRGFARIRANERKLVIGDIGLHEKNGIHWASLPAKPQVHDSAICHRSEQRQARLSLHPRVRWAQGALGTRRVTPSRPPCWLRRHREEAAFLRS